jgi:hypothetical protein
MNQNRMAAQQRSNKRSSRGMSPGRSMAQFGHAGHAGKSQSKAQKHQKAGINTPSRGPGSNPNMGQTPPKKTATVPTQTKQGILSKVDTVANFLGPFVDPRKKAGQLIQLYKLLRNPTGYREDAQSYRGGDIQPWDEDDVSGIGSFNLADMGITTPDTDYTQLAKVYGAPELTEWGATPGMFKDTAKFNDMEAYQEQALKQFKANKPIDQIRKSIDMGSSLYGIDMGNVPKDFYSTKEDFKKQPILGDIKFNKGGIVNLFKYGGFLG